MGAGNHTGKWAAISFRRVVELRTVAGSLSVRSSFEPVKGESENLPRHSQ